METGFLNFHDGEHFSSISSPLYDQDILDDSEGSLLDIMRDDFSYEASQFTDPNDLWDQEQELNGDLALLPLTVSLDGPMPKLEPHSKEDFQKMLSEWQEHLGSMQASDTEDMDVKDIVGMDIVMPKDDADDLPNEIFENPSLEFKPISPVTDKFLSRVKQEHQVTRSFSIKEDFSALSIDTFLEGDDEDEEDKFVLTVAEELDKLPDLDEESEELLSLPSDPLKSEFDEGCVDLDSIKIEIEEDCIDVETVSEQMPVLEAGDLSSLLEQFEASEAVNPSTPVSPSKKSILDSHLHAMATQQLDTSTHTTTTAGKTMNPVLSHQNIRDSLPKEVIERIKASGRKKVIPVIPAMPSKRPGRSGTRMQDAAATLSRNKLLKLVSGNGNGGGESVQLDHDYCTFSNNSNASDAAPPKSFYHSDASEYCGEKKRLSTLSNENTEEISAKSCPPSPQDKVFSRLPEYYMLLTPQKVGRRGSSKDDGWDKNSRKDSGLESGDVSDASEETVGSNMCDSTAANSENKTRVSLLSFSNNIKDSSSSNSRNSKNNKFSAIVKTDNAQSPKKTIKETPMVSVLKVNNNNNGASGHSLLLRSVSNTSDCSSSSSQENVFPEVKENRPQEPRKRKLNLEEYRSRVKELDRIRSSRDSSRTSSPSPGQDASTVDKPDADTNTSSTPEVGSSESKETLQEVVEGDNDSNSQPRPQMQSVEVQTIQPESEELKEPEKERRPGQIRDRRHRQYRSRRTSSSSSSGSSSSSCRSSSHSSRRRRRNSLSTRRQRPSQRRSSGGHSISSSGSRSRSLWSRSCSNSSHSSSSSDSSRSRSRGSRRSPNRWQPRSGARYSDARRRPSNNSGYHGWRRSRSPARSVSSSRKGTGKDWQLTEREKQRQVEERRVIYVGRIEEGTSKAELRRRFEVFGPIVDISVHFREHGDNYGFVTFAYKVDAYEAVEHGNDDPKLPRYDLCFGGRRAFCKTRYADLDGIATLNDNVPAANGYSRSFGRVRAPQTEDSFDLLLREAQAKLRKRKV